MKIIEWQQFIKTGLNQNKKKSSMTVGVFDGVHRGHQALIERVVSFNADYAPAVVTFRENHKKMKNELLAEKLPAFTDIQSFQERLFMFEKLGIQITIVVDFTEKFRQMPGIEFLEILIKHGSLGFFAVGKNFRCGCGLDTSADAIQKFFASRGIPAEIVPEVLEGLKPVSSSRIREAVAAGDFSLAETLLGRVL